MKRLATTVVATTALVVTVMATPAQATFHGKNGRIALTLDRGDGAQIYTIRRDGSLLRRLTDLNSVVAATPDWSPDGTQIVFGLVPPGEDSACTIEIVNADGSGLHRLAGKAKRRSCYANPAFTPKGHRIVVTFQQDTIWSMDLHARDRRMILDVTPLCANTKYPDCTTDRLQVSPDGTMVGSR